ncbi:MAG: DNA primase [Eubacteriales bacterium]|nr:DNA primase [Eubacteriales bacterium]
MYYPQEIVDEVLANTDIVDVISAHVHLKKRGKDYVGLCPFHNEKTPSFTVVPGKNMYYCFGCGAGGSAVTFLMKYNNSTFTEALQELADRAGITLPVRELSEEAGKREKHRQDLLAVNKETATYYYKLLRSRRGERGMRYFAGRQLSPEALNKFGLGFADGSRNDLTAYLRKKGFSDDLILESDVALFNEKQGVHDRFWNRVMFPIQDVRGRVIGFGGRVLGDSKPKYINSSDTEIFDKGRNLYALNLARRSKKDYLILCEGYMDVIAMHQAGFIEAVASLGTAFTPGQASLLHRYTNRVLLAYDSDGAGVRAALRNIGILRSAGLDTAVIDLRPHKDPDEFIKKEGKEAFQERIDQAENSFFYELRMLSRSYTMDDPAQRTAFHREIAKRLCRFSDEIERDNYITAVADKYLIKLESLRRLVASYGEATGYGDQNERGRAGTAGYAQAYRGGRNGAVETGRAAGYAQAYRGGGRNGDRETGRTAAGTGAGEQVHGARQAGPGAGEKSRDTRQTGAGPGRQGLDQGQAGTGSGRQEKAGPAVRAGRPGGASPLSRAELALLNKQRMLLTMIIDERSVFPIVRRYLTPADFDGTLFRKTAEILWEQLEQGGDSACAASVISAFDTPEEQEAVAAMLNARAPEAEDGPPDPDGLGRTLRELVIAVKESSIARMSRTDGGSPASLQDLLAAKKLLQTIRTARFNV